MFFILKDPAFSLLLLLQCILVVFAIVAVSNAIPIELGHYAAPVYAPVAKAILPEPVVSVCSINFSYERLFFLSLSIAMYIRVARNV